MTIYRLHAQQFFDGKTIKSQQVLTITDGKIVAIDQDITCVDYVAEGLVAPGYIDLQVNGGGGALFNAAPTVECIKTILSAHAQFGTTGMMPTLITDKVEIMSQAADAIAKAIALKVPGVLGIHFEGPHLSIAKKGTHNEEYIRAISTEEWKVLERKDLGQIMVTLAPETVLCDDISRMVGLGIKVCLGHTNADYVTAQKAIAAGATGFTHLFNAMSPLQGREPGVVGAALLNDHTYCGLIVDGHHVDYVSCKLAIKTKPTGKVFLVTDAMPPVGTDETEFAFFNRTVTLDNGRLTSTTGELAGAVLDMATAVRNTHHQLSIPLVEAFRMASKYPADYLYKQEYLQNYTLEKRGVLQPGSPADFIILDEALVVQETWIAGQQVFKK